MPRCGFGVLQSGRSGSVALAPATTAQELGTVERLAHWTVICQPIGTVRISVPSP